MKKYNLINNSLGWLCFVIAAVTYLCTLEPTASFWDCPEFITQGYKLEVGHPPGNPIFMLTARFFVTVFGGTAQNAALAVNSMSALLSAGTILLLFWTITHLVRKLIVKDDAPEISLQKTLLIMGAGLCGALVYTWSDTFWFSAVEGEVYAFSSFCTALVFWLILKWENRADLPHSDRYLILIAYVIGISIAVHLLNLLCIPAIVLVFYYKKFKNPTLVGSLAALGVSAALVVLILYGLVPGFIAVAQRFELFFVNTVGLPFNGGVLVYALLTVAVFIWTIWQIYRQRSAMAIKIGVLLSIILSGMPFIGHGWLIPFVLICGLAVYLFGFCRKVPVRIFNVVITSVLVIFIGYSSYALLLIRASADTPMNQNAPDNVFSLASYLSREQYGDRPLLYGQTLAEELKQPIVAGTDENGYPIYVYEVDGEGYPVTQPVSGIVYEASMPVDEAADENTYAKEVKTSPDQPDRYVAAVHRPEYAYSSDIKMLLPRIYDTRHLANYKSWSQYENEDFADIPATLRARWRNAGYAPAYELTPFINNQRDINMGTAVDSKGYEQDYIIPAWKMGLGANLRFFFNYQLNHMYWRYFMWNFAGRQNDLQGNGEPHLGNWISGIPALDNLRLGDQSELPAEFGSANKGHNVFYMLPLLLGLIGLLWQALSNHPAGSRRGIEQFWVIFFLFFMTGIAIVLYLNQTPGQPRERDYAFAGSFYAFAIWIGLGVPAIASLLTQLARFITSRKAKKEKAADDSTAQPLDKRLTWTFTALAVVIGLAVPLQMVSQTWDDHDRSGRYTARDFGMNYLNSLDENAIIFTNGDNDTFPLWYAQEVEGERTDVKVVNLSYLSTDWYANSVRRPSYNAQGVPMYARPQDYAYEKFWMRNGADSSDSLAMAPITAEKALREFYTHTSEATKRLLDKNSVGYSDVDFVLATPNIYVPLDSAALKSTFGRVPDTYDANLGGYYMPLPASMLGSSAGLRQMLSYDIIANSTAGGWKRPVYFANTVQNDMYLGLDPYMYTTGMAKMVTPFGDSATSPVADKAYRNIMSRWRWGGLDQGREVYLDETVKRMVSSTRLAVLDVVNDLLANPNAPATEWAKQYAREHNEPVPATQTDMARRLLQEMDKHLPASVAPYSSYVDLQRAEMLSTIYSLSNRATDLEAATKALDACIDRYAAHVKYATSITPAWRSRLGREERQNLGFLAVAVGLRNYLELRQDMIKAGAPAEDIADLDRISNTGYGQYTYDWTYVNPISQQSLQSFYEQGQYDYLAAAVELLREFHGKYQPGTDILKRAKEVAAKNGFTLDDWKEL